MKETETLIVRAAHSIYSPVLAAVLKHRRATVALGAIFLALSFLAGSRLGTEFLPALEEGNLWIRASMPPTISLDAGMPVVDRMRKF